MEEFTLEACFDLQNVQFISAMEVIDSRKCMYISLSIVQLQQDCQPVNRIFLIELISAGDKLQLEYKLEIQQGEEIVSDIIYFNDLLYVVCDTKIIVYDMEEFKQLLVKKHYKTLLTSHSSQGQLLQLGDVKRGFLIMCLTHSPQDGSLDLQYFNEEGNNVPVSTNCLYTSQDQIHSAVSDRLGNLLIYDVANELTRVADLHLNSRIHLMRSYLDSRNRTTLFLFSSLARQASLLSLDHYRPNPSFDFQSLLSL